jgi:protoporphyrin/coproporphyrin ferrochelatase
MTPTAVLLFNLGGPDDLASVEPFLVNLFSDREIIELPLGAALQPVLARVIAKLRGPGVRRNYERIGGGSPQLRITRAQAEALEQRLNVAHPGGSPYRVFIAMRYSRPSSEDALRAIADAGIRRIVTLTLFPHYSKATTGSSMREFVRTLDKPEWRAMNFEVTHVDRYAADPRYLDAMAEQVSVAWERIPGAQRSETVLLFSAHGLPQKFIDDGDPYVDDIEATRLGILERLPFAPRQVLAYQSRTGPVKWIGPGTEEMLQSLGAQGVRNVLVVPLSFVSDHI